MKITQLRKRYFFACHYSSSSLDKVSEVKLIRSNIIGRSQTKTYGYRIIYI